MGSEAQIQGNLYPEKVVPPPDVLLEAQDNETMSDIEESAWSSHKVWFRHPAFRMFLTLLIIVCDFFIYGEDPIYDSDVEAVIPPLGNMLGMTLRKYYFGENSLALLKLILVVFSFVLGMIVGKLFLHDFIFRDKLRLRMFSEDKGSWTCMLATCCFFSYAFCMLYNMMLPDTRAEDWDGPPLYVSAGMGSSNRTFGALFQAGTWLGDLMTVVMVWDSIFQDYTRYPNWAKGWKHIWNNSCNGWFRIVAVYGGAISSTMAVFLGIYLTGHGNTLDYNGKAFTGELTRIFVITIIICADVFIVVQDWTFPTFDDDINIKVAGTFETHIRCDCLMKVFNKVGCCNKLIQSKFWDVTVTGKWMNYFFIIGILGLDINMMKNQILYRPQDFGQYVHPETEEVWVILDPLVLTTAYDEGVLIHPELITWEARQALNFTSRGIPDVNIYSQWTGESLALKTAVGIPGFIAIALFIISIFMGNKSKKRVKARGLTQEKKAMEVVLVTPKASSTQ